MSWYTRIPLHRRLIAGILFGLLLGFTLHAINDTSPNIVAWVTWITDIIGKDIFIGALKVIVAPLIFCAIVSGISGLPSALELGSLGVKTLAFYTTTVFIAVLVGVFFTWLIDPGNKPGSLDLRERRAQEIEQHRGTFEAESRLGPKDEAYAAEFRAYLARQEGASDATSQTAKAAADLTPGRMLRESIIQPTLDNPFHALAASPPNTLGIIFFAILLGTACLVLGATAEPIAAFFRAGNEVMMLMARWIMELAPIATACLIASLLATLGFDAIRALFWFVLTVVLGLLAHACVLLCLVRFVGKMSPFAFLRGMRAPMVIAFTTASSTATLPTTMHALKHRLGIHPRVTDFALPIGASVNMDGSALYEAVALLFLVQVYGGLADVPIFFDPMMVFLIGFMSAVTAIGIVGIPSASLITMVLIANMVGLPLHYIVLIYAVNHILDMCRTTVNVTGDATGAVVVNHLERKRLAIET